MGNSNWNTLFSAYPLTEANDAHEILEHDVATETTYRITRANFLSGVSGAMLGEVRMYAGATPPDGWLICNGSAVSRTTYSDLFALIGTTFGVGDGSTTFNLPDFQGRSPVGVGSGSGLSVRALADQGGDESHQLLEAELPSHSHQEKSNIAGSGAVGITTLSSANPTGYPRDVYTEAVGGDESHNTMHPFLCVNFIIYTGVIV